MMTDVAKENLDYWMEKEEEHRKKRFEAQNEVEACMRKFFDVDDPRSAEGLRAKAEWDFAVTNLSKIEIENGIDELYLPVISLLITGAEPEDVLSFMHKAVEKAVATACMKTLDLCFKEEAHDEQNKSDN